MGCQAFEITSCISLSLADADNWLPQLSVFAKAQQNLALDPMTLLLQPNRIMWPSE